MHSEMGRFAMPEDVNYEEEISIQDKITNTRRANFEFNFEEL